jgi:hypothetical protein
MGVRSKKLGSYGALFLSLFFYSQETKAIIFLNFDQAERHLQKMHGSIQNVDGAITAQVDEQVPPDFREVGTWS